MAYHVNETMRDLNKRNDWDDDLLEDVVPVPDPNQATHWTPAEGPERFRREEYVEYDGHCEPTRVKPSRRIQRLDKYYYRSGATFVFVGALMQVKMAYYAYVPWLQYYPTGTRPSIWDGATQTWTNPPANDLVTNWLLMRHNEVILSGTLARHFASKADPRQQVHYAQYEQRVKQMRKAEGVDELLGRRNG